MNLKNGTIPMHEILANEKAKALLQKEFPMLMNRQILEMSKNMTLQSIIQLAQNYFPRAKISQVISELKKL